MLWHCQGCSTAYAVGLLACPQCGSTDYVEEGSEDMPKITVHGGPSNIDGLAPENTGPETVGEAADGEPVPAAPNYSALKVDKLREELSRRGLDTEGVRAELVDRLTESDKADGDG